MSPEAKDLRDESLTLAIRAYQQYISEWAKNKGFWAYTCPFPSPDGNMTYNKLMPIEHNTIKGTKLMLIVSELGECLEAIRKGDKENEAEELADAAIRIMDYAGTYRIDLGTAIVKKMAVNEGRPFMHGKAF